jgi:nicotinic acid phosphoribosyltransferase
MNGLQLTDVAKVVMGCAPAALATTAGDGDYVSLKGYSKLTILLAVLNATTVTGGAITLKQASAVAGTGEKALAFTKMYANIDCAASDTLVETAVASNTFTTDTTNSKQLLYVIEVDAGDLDVAGGFDCVRIDSASMAAAVGSAVYVLHDSRYASPNAISAITD